MVCVNCNAELPAGARFCPACATPVRVSDSNPADPIRVILESNLGFQYRIERILGRGGMGAVYLAHEFALDRDVAIKVLPPEQAITPELRERFRREARTAARLSHPNIVPLHTFGEVGGLIYFVMGYVAGQSLGARLKQEHRIPAEDTRQLIAEIAGALEYAHRHGVVHRDIKPDNILLDQSSSRPVLTDFGIAKAPLTDDSLTMTGMLIGTPAYMSPEQASGRNDLDGRSDIYSLGVVAYQSLSGQLPFQADTPMEAAMQRISNPPQPLGSVAQDLPDDLVSTVTRCLATRREDRWPDALALQQALIGADDDVDPDVLAKLLRLGVRVVPPSLLAAVWTQVFAYLSSSRGAWDRLSTFLLGQAAVFTMLAVVSVVRMRARGESPLVITRKALEQPRWWAGWYPHAWRRRGDVWNDLPVQLRRWRVYWSMLILYQGIVFIPWMAGYVTALSSDGYGRETNLIFGVVVALVVMFLIERRRAVRWAADRLSHLGVRGAADAALALTTPPWRRSAWHRPPLEALLTRLPQSSRRVRA